MVERKTFKVIVDYVNKETKFISTLYVYEAENETVMIYYLLHHLIYNIQQGYKIINIRFFDEKKEGEL